MSCHSFSKPPLSSLLICKPKTFTFSPIFIIHHLLLTYKLKPYPWAICQRSAKLQLLTGSTSSSLNHCFRLASPWEQLPEKLRPRYPQFGNILLSLHFKSLLHVISLHAPYYHYIYRLLFHTLVIGTWIPSLLFEKLGHAFLSSYLRNNS